MIGDSIKIKRELCRTANTFVSTHKQNHCLTTNWKVPDSQMWIIPIFVIYAASYLLRIICRKIFCQTVRCSCPAFSPLQTRSGTVILRVTRPPQYGSRLTMKQIRCLWNWVNISAMWFSMGVYRCCSRTSRDYRRRTHLQQLVPAPYRIRCRNRDFWREQYADHRRGDVWKILFTGYRPSCCSEAHRYKKNVAYISEMIPVDYV